MEACDSFKMHQAHSEENGEQVKDHKEWSNLKTQCGEESSETLGLETRKLVF